MISYDDWNDDGGKPLYVTRVSPDTDFGAPVISGTWAPIGAGSNAAAIESPFNTGSYSRNAAASSGEHLVVSAGGGTLASKLNIDVASTIYGITNHAYVTGSGLSGSVGIGKDALPLIFATGSDIFPDTNDPTYGFVTSGSFVATDSPLMVYEVK